MIDKDTSDTTKINPPVDVDDEELLEEDEDILRIPRSGKRQLMPIERLR